MLFVNKERTSRTFDTTYDNEILSIEIHFCDPVRSGSQDPIIGISAKLLLELIILNNLSTFADSNSYLPAAILDYLLIHDHITQQQAGR